jgi:hypothetical protein
VITSWLLLLVFLAPTGIGLIRSVEKHKHNSCTETLTHIHKKNDDCVTCDFSFSNFEFKFEDISFENKDLFLESNSIAQKVIFITSNISDFDSRGPPFDV